MPQKWRRKNARVKDTKPEDYHKPKTWDNEFQLIDKQICLVQFSQCEVKHAATLRADDLNCRIYYAKHKYRKTNLHK